MPTTIPSDLRELISRSDVLKILSSVDQNGVPHAAAIDDLDIDQDGREVVA